MELYEAGKFDILSGTYSRKDSDMAGLFQVLRAQTDGTWKKAEPLRGTDGEPLILPKQKAGGDDDGVVDCICTRPFAVDLDGDGKLDIVSGNFRGTFGWFRGEGGGKFAPKAEWLQAGGGAMRVDSHSDPFLVDLDGDGDFDLVSGSAQGGVFLFRNVGTKTAPKFAARTTLVEAAGYPRGDAEPTFGDAHLTGPQSSTRVWVADVDGDGKLDLLVGDSVHLLHTAKGVDEATARTKDAEWRKRQAEFFKVVPDDDEAAQKKWHADYEALAEARKQFVVEEATGYVWLLRGK